jgi:hypothetical protein
MMMADMMGELAGKRHALFTTWWGDLDTTISERFMARSRSRGDETLISGR